ncbi:FAD-binding protein [Candidatus Berkiella aquae]|uniref:Electron transfer flavoprotein subunit alpha n=1 Tax=Candidatus Berkiella aquae TaxID=295108 RepID=A0A0Q9YR45_9GAMM|nr:FAD-binding protein [Candidatus Berkiella aquae]MCS5712422.1 FAD-binding protein [Candidatus Berkiella aquae]
MNKVLVIAEQTDGKLAASNGATIAAALKLAQHCDVLLACDNAQLAAALSELSGVKTIKTIVQQRFLHVLAEDLAPIIVKQAASYSHILAPATTFGKNLLPRVAALLDVAMISDVTLIENADTFVRPIYAGNAFETVQSMDLIKLLTIRTTAFDAIAKGENKATIESLTEEFTPYPAIHFVLADTPEMTRPDLTTAKIVVSGGRGLKSKENFHIVESLADKLGAAVGASRAAVDAGFVPNELQVGQTGKMVAPTLYIAIGISGAIQHLAGMKDSKVIVAINKDSDAPIFQVADYGIVGDLFTIVPEIEKAL